MIICYNLHCKDCQIFRYLFGINNFNNIKNLVYGVKRDGNGIRTDEIRISLYCASMPI